MRDITICKKCRYFVEDYLLHYRNFSARHMCQFDLGHIVMKYDIIASTEFYKMPVPESCPFKFEHHVCEMNSDYGKVDYGPLRHFRKTRTCQHCGNTIPNVKQCPKCGYDMFNLENPWYEAFSLVQFVLFSGFAVGYAIYRIFS